MAADPDIQAEITHIDDEFRLMEYADSSLDSVSHQPQDVRHHCNKPGLWVG